MYVTLDHVCTLLFTSLLIFKAMSHTVFLEFYPLTKFAGNIGSFKSVKIFPYYIIVKGCILHVEHIFHVEVFRVLLHKSGHSKNFPAHTNVNCSSAHVKLI